MPIVIGRREFLAGAIAAVGVRAFAQPSSARWALLSDTHCPEEATDTFRGFRPAENLKTAVTQVSASSFDGYLVNGDLARQVGSPGDYRRFLDSTTALSSKAPLALALGNHDDRKNALTACRSTAGAKETVADKWVSVIEGGPLRILILDSLFQTNLASGLLGKAQREWLDAYLRGNGEKPTIVFVHHTLDDSDGSLLDADRFLKIVLPQWHVKAVFYGHSHTYRYEVRNGLHLVNLPAVGYNFADSEPVGWVEAEWSAKSARLTLHAFAGDRSQDGKTRDLEWRA